MSMAGVEQARAEAVSMLQGDPAKNNLLVQNNPGSYHQLHSNSSFAATRRMQHRKRFLRHHILREPVGQPGRQPRISILPPPAPELGEIMDESELKFLFEKKLQRSDVDQSGRIVLPKSEAEMYLPILGDRKSLYIDLSDLDHLQQLWTFSFRFWVNIKSSRMYLFENTSLIRAVKKEYGYNKVLPPTTDGNGIEQSPTMDGYGLAPPYGTSTTDMKDHSTLGIYSGVQPYNPQLEPSGLAGNHQPSGTVPNGIEIPIPVPTTEHAVNANLPSMNEYGSPFFNGSRNNINDDYMGFYSGMTPDNSEPEPSASIDWKELADWLE
ncbi:B3 domain-containing protein LFL1 [Morella rubra]|uniref:B3 domain-containing protein LFL1 n=1 Tax=Morella rubra TaxID=262757 RepID=A0A6A1V4I0_9ROSI|nr:B3 domain-containing protein LFL1 [Morella rubra]